MHTDVVACKFYEIMDSFCSAVFKVRRYEQAGPVPIVCTTDVTDEGLSA